MEEKLITLAIHTFEKAQMLKLILESEGIDVYIHNVNQIQPVISAGVRVRIKESDLPHALRIIEENTWLESKEEEVRKKENGCDGVTKRILVPVDFSDYSLKACKLAINYAANVGATVKILHSYYTPYVPPVIPLNDTLAYQANEEVMRVTVERIQKDMFALCSEIDQLMNAGKLPKVKYGYTLREGLPEEEIVSFSKSWQADLIFMGTRGKAKKDADLIGSVTGEVIDLSKIPVFAIPEEVAFTSLAEIENVAFATSFSQKDLVAFDQFMEIIKGYSVNIHLFNISTSRNEWNEIRLTGIQTYFKKQYPEATISFSVLDDGDLLSAIDKFVSEKSIKLIALTNYRRSLLSRLFNSSLARRMLFHTNTPMLVMHG